MSWRLNELIYRRGWRQCLTEPRKASCCKHIGGTLPAVQGLRLRLSAKIPHALLPKHHNIKQKLYCNKFNKDFKNGPHFSLIFKKKKKEGRKKGKLTEDARPRKGIHLGISTGMPTFLHPACVILGKSLFLFPGPRFPLLQSGGAWNQAPQVRTK